MAVHPKEADVYPSPNQPAEFVKQTCPVEPYPDYPPAYPGQQEMIALSVPGQVPSVAGQPPTTIVVVQARGNNQVPGLVPGCAFCKFVPGVIETIIRLSLVVSYSAFVS